MSMTLPLLRQWFAGSPLAELLMGWSEGRRRRGRRVTPLFDPLRDLFAGARRPQATTAASAVPAGAEAASAFEGRVAMPWARQVLSGLSLPTGGALPMQVSLFGRRPTYRGRGLSYGR